MTSHENPTTVKVAVVQAGSVPFDTDACVAKALRLIADGASTGAKVIVFPEAFITGYPKGLNFGLVVGARDAVGREEFRLYLEAAIDVPGPQTLQLGKLRPHTAATWSWASLSVSVALATARCCSSARTVSCSGSIASSCRRRWNG